MRRSRAAIGGCVALLLVSPSALFATAARAGKADVLAVDVHCRPAPGGRPASVCQFSATIRHADEGWEHYADRFDIVGPDGKVLATRPLEHPHVEEQPFRRSIGRIRIPYSISTVRVRAHDSVHGGGGAEVAVEIPHARKPE